MKIITFLLAVSLPLGANSLPSEKRKNGPLVQDALSPVQVSLQESSAVFYSNETSKAFLYGTVVSDDGLIMTKSSEIEEVESYYVRVGTNKFRNPVVVARNDVWDVMMVKIEAEGLKPVDFSQAKDLAHGTWVVSNGATERRFRRPRAGIISANKREIPGGSPAVLGVGLTEKDGDLLVGEITEDSGAADAGLKEGDKLLKVDGSDIKDRDGLVTYLKEKSPGDKIKLTLVRGEEEMTLEVELMARHKLYGKGTTRNDQLSGGPNQQSARRTGFPMVLQHETMLNRYTVGGPIFTLDNQFVGMNIAAVNRVEAFAIPGKELSEIVADLKKSL
ncbi:PDZ domain-containing protein [Akkermansiaceae bacterium]|jgi:serine protease Do|nr:PDZ domain-containing protein [Akkermansiaceae bacterium]